MAPNLSIIRAGDLILTKTSSPIYNVLRALTSEPYDHIAVVLNDKLVLHIGPGLIRTLSLVRLLEPKRSPIVLRPILSDEGKKKFLSQCWSMIGQKYDLIRVFDFVLRLILLNWTPIKIPFRKIRVDILNQTKQNKNKLWLCSDAVMTNLIAAHPKYREYLIKDKDSEKCEIMLNKLGSLTIKDFLTIATKSNDLFEIITLPLSNNNNEHKHKQVLNILNELTFAQKLLLMICIIYLLSTLFPRKQSRQKL